MTLLLSSAVLVQAALATTISAQSSLIITGPVSPLTAEERIDKIIARHREMATGTVVIVRGNDQRVIKFSHPNLLATRLTLARLSPGQITTEQICISNRSDVSVYQPFSNELYRTKVDAPKNLLGRLGTVGLTKDEVAQMLVSPGVLSDFLTAVKNYKGWTQKPGVLFAKGTGKAGRYNARLTFDKTYRLTEVKIKEAGVNYAFKWQWDPARSGIAIPTSGYRAVVSAFAPPVKFPRADKKALDVLIKLVRSNSRYVAGRFCAITPSGRTTITFGKGKFAQVTPISRWQWDGKTFTYARGKNRQTKSIKADLRKTRESVGILKDTIHPMLLSLMKGELPVQSLLNSEDNAVYQGQLGLNGRRVDIVKIKPRASLALTLFIDVETGRLIAIDSDAISRTGQRLASQRTEYRYF